MSKQGIEREIGRMTDEVLSGLSADERVAEFFTAASRDKTEWMQRLEETTPTETHQHRELEYVSRRLASERVAHHAIYEIATWRLRYCWTRCARVLLSLQAVTDLEFGGVADERLEGEPERCLTRLLLTLEKYDRFAEDELDSSLEEWLGSFEHGLAELQAAHRLLIREFGDWVESIEADDEAEATAAGGDSDD